MLDKMFERVENMLCLMLLYILHTYYCFFANVSGLRKLINMKHKYDLVVWFWCSSIRLMRSFVFENIFELDLDLKVKIDWIFLKVWVVRKVNEDTKIDSNIQEKKIKSIEM